MPTAGEQFFSDMPNRATISASPPSASGGAKFLEDVEEPRPTAAPAAPPSGALPWYYRWPAGIANAAASGALSLGDMLAPTLAPAFQQPQELSALASKYGAAQPVDVPLPHLMSSWAVGPLAPQSAAERYVQAGASGLGAAVPMVLTGGASIPAYVSSVGGSLASQGAADLGLPPGMQLAAGLVTGLTTHGLASLGSQRTITDVANDLGSSKTYQEAGSVLRSEAQHFKDNVFPQILADAEAPVNALIPGSTKGDASNLVGALGLLYARGGEDAISARSFMQKMAASGGRTGATAKAVNQYFDDVNKFNTLGGTPPSVPEISWSEGRNWRTNGLGNWLEKSPSDTTAKKLLWGATSEDLNSIASSVSPDAAQAFQSYNQLASHLYDLRDGPIERILGAPDDASAATRLINDARTHRSNEQLEALKNVLPTGIGELASADLRLNPSARGWSRYGQAPEVQASLVPSAEDRQIIESTGPHKGEPSIGTKMLESIGGGEALSRLGGLAMGAMSSSPFVAKMGEYGFGLLGQSLPWLGSAARSLFADPRAPMAGFAGANAPIYMRAPPSFAP